ncbi:hypothetical protein EZS27_014130 [termite gut metagenome]|uniref:Uncharacterized protein n=1 Tax=termite gut metagenome TaxID=433724 RepID=A0A5J4RUW7_9ZZZZ
MFVILLIFSYKNHIFKLYLPAFYSPFFVDLRFAPLKKAINFVKE